MINMDLKTVSKFFVVQADGPEDLKETVLDEKEFVNLQDAVEIVQKSEAPVKYLKFNHDGFSYKMYPIPDSEEYQVLKSPIIN